MAKSQAQSTEAPKEQQVFQFLVISPIRLEGKTVPPGKTVELSEKDGKELTAIGAVKKA